MWKKLLVLLLFTPLLLGCRAKGPTPPPPPPEFEKPTRGPRLEDFLIQEAPTVAEPLNEPASE